MIVEGVRWGEIEWGGSVATEKVEPDSALRKKKENWNWPEQLSEFLNSQVLTVVSSEQQM